MIIAVSLFMENMDSSLIATALPSIAADLRTEPISLKLAVTTYLLALTVVLPVSGWVADRFGAKTVFSAAILWFAAASLLCGSAQSLEQLVLARWLQGMAGALMVPVGRLIVLRAVPKSQLIDTLAWLVVPALIGPLIGPPIGGFLTTFVDWRWIFWINLPIGAIAFILAWKYLPESAPQPNLSLDLRGSILAGAGLVLVAGGLTAAGPGQNAIALPLALICVLAGIALLYGYWRHARSASDPILDLSLLRIETFRIGVVSGSVYRIGIGASPFLMPIMLQVGFGYTAFESGLITCASALGALIVKPFAGRIIRVTGFRNLLLANVLLSCVLMAAGAFFSSATPPAVMMGVLAFSGFFRSLQFTSLNAMSYADIESREMSKATSMFSVAQQMSLAAGVTIAAAILEISMWSSGREILTADDASIAILVVSAMSALSVIGLFRLRPHAGSSVSGKALSDENENVTGKDQL
jgi:EmrB/QacA subfamily drug resistance transporter